MMEFALAWTAFRNMLRAAAADPLWVIIAIIAGPFRFGRHLIQNSLFFILVVTVVDFGPLHDRQGAGDDRPFRGYGRRLFRPPRR